MRSVFLNYRVDPHWLQHNLPWLALLGVLLGFAPLDADDRPQIDELNG